MKNLLIFLFIICGLHIGQAQHLEKVPKIWEQPAPHRLTKAEYLATLDFWAEKHRDRLTVEKSGVTATGDGIHTITITDPAFSSAEKQHSLITSMHGGPERSGTTTCFHLVEWLVSDDPEAVKIRQHQVVKIMPILNPLAYFVTDRFGNEAKVDPYTAGGANAWDFSTLTLKAPEKAPELVAFLKVVDEFQPEAHLDLHGTGLQEYGAEQLGDRKRYQGQTMTEITGSAYSNYSLRPWDWRITEKMIAAGQAAGYPSDRFEADAQRAFWGLSLNRVAGQLWRGRPFFYPAQYAYLKYHTVIGALEIGWEKSGLERTKAWLAMGNEAWPGEKTRGYPVDRMNAFIGHFITACGKSAEARRQNRIALWRRQAAFSKGVLYPQTDGRSLYFVATTPEAIELLDSEPGQLIRNLRDRPFFDTGAIEEFVDYGPEIKLAFEKGSQPLDSTPLPEGTSIGFRIRIPYREPELVDVRLNGNLLPKAEWNGYETWFGNGYTQVQINLEPDKIGEANGLFIISIGYVPDEARTIGWTPPAAVLDQLKARDPAE